MASIYPFEDIIYRFRCKNAVKVWLQDFTPPEGWSWGSADGEFITFHTKTPSTEKAWEVRHWIDSVERTGHG